MVLITQVSDEIFNVVDHILEVPMTELQESQAEFNSTNRYSALICWHPDSDIFLL